MNALDISELRENFDEIIDEHSEIIELDKKIHKLIEQMQSLLDQEDTDHKGMLMLSQDIQKKAESIALGQDVMDGELYFDLSRAFANLEEEIQRHIDG